MGEQMLCPWCGRTMWVMDSLRGQVIACSYCRKDVSIPVLAGEVAFPEKPAGQEESLRWDEPVVEPGPDVRKKSFVHAELAAEGSADAEDKPAQEQATPPPEDALTSEPPIPYVTPVRYKPSEPVLSSPERGTMSWKKPPRPPKMPPLTQPPPRKGPPPIDKPPRPEEVVFGSTRRVDPMMDVPSYMTSAILTTVLILLPAAVCWFMDARTGGPRLSRTFLGVVHVAAACLLPLGISAIAHAAQVGVRLDAGEGAGALAASERAGRWSLRAFLAGLLQAITFVLVGLVS